LIDQFLLEVLDLLRTAQLARRTNRTHDCQAHVRSASSKEMTLHESQRFFRIPDHRSTSNSCRLRAARPASLLKKAQVGLKEHETWLTVGLGPPDPPAFAGRSLW